MSTPLKTHLQICPMQESMPLPEPVADVDETEHVVVVAVEAIALEGLLALLTFIFSVDVAIWQIFAVVQPFLATAFAYTRIREDCVIQHPFKFMRYQACRQLDMCIY
jgi:hypothetical protein